MKRQFLFIFFTFLLLFSCRGDEETLQNIDQILNIYVQNASGQDLINNKIPGSYTNVQFLDLLSDTNLKPVTTLSLQKDKDTVTYIDYMAGAVRLIKDSLNPENKTYYSEMIMRFSKTVNSQTVNDDDTIRIEYSWTPDLFQVSKMWHSDQLVFTKVKGQPNIVRIVK